MEDIARLYKQERPQGGYLGLTTMKYILGMVTSVTTEANLCKDHPERNTPRNEVYLDESKPITFT